MAKPGDEIWIAKGVYFPDDSRDGKGLGDREKSFVLNDVRIYGGFAGTETSVAQRDLTKNKTYLDGAIWADDQYDDGEGDEIYWSLNVVTVVADSLLNGVTVRHGNASGYFFSSPKHSGGGAVVKGSATLSLDDCDFYRNRAVSKGGAISGKVRAIRTRFEENSIYPIFSAFAPSVYMGGAISGSADVDRCEFVDNSIDTTFAYTFNLTAEGGAIAGSVTARDCLFEDNGIVFDDFAKGASKGVGGAISGENRLVNCQFVGNWLELDVQCDIDPGASVDVAGGAVDGNSQMTNCVFESNLVTGDLRGAAKEDFNDVLYAGGGAVHLRSGDSTVTNCVFYDNRWEAGFSGFRFDLNVLTDSFIEGGAILLSGNLGAIASSTFVNNEFDGIGAGAIGVCKRGELNLLNNILWNNPGFNQVYLYTNVSMLRISTKVYPTPSSQARNLVSGGGSEFGGAGDLNQLGNPEVTLIDENPRFVNIGNPRGADGKWGTDDDGLRLTKESPANDVSKFFYFWQTEFKDVAPRDLLSNFLPLDILDFDFDTNTEEKIEVDFANFARIQNLYLDLGAYEYGDIALRPEIDVQFPENKSLVDGSAEVKFFDAALGSFTERTFVIRNTGPKKLGEFSVSFTGANAGDFSITNDLPAFINSNGSAKLTVRFRPSFTGMHTAGLHIGSNDSNENPFDIQLSGKGGRSDIVVEVGGRNLKDGAATVNFGSIGHTETEDRVFKISNRGNINLAISKIAVTGKSFIFGKSPKVIAPGKTASLRVRFRPGTAGAKSAKLAIRSNDANESPFNILLKGRGILIPDILVSQPVNQPVRDGGARSFGTVNVGETYTKTFTISSVGDAGLRNLSVSVAGSRRFTVTPLRSEILRKGETTFFRLQFNPVSTRLEDAVVTVRSNDPNENPYTIRVSGRGKQPKKLAALAAEWNDDGGSSGIAARTSTHVSPDGAKYLELTVEKKPGSKPLVEVSADRVKWFSGTRHTTVIADNAKWLRVRDKTPVTKSNKRAIRVRRIDR